MLQARGALRGSRQQQRHGRAILNVGRVHLGAQHQALAVHQDVALAGIDAPGAVVAASTDSGRPDRLAVDDASAGLWVAPDGDPELLAQHHVQVFPGSVQTPETKTVIGGLPGSSS
jgi:hypothetical protein